MQKRLDIEDAIIQCLQCLGDDELKVLAIFTSRLLTGQEQYGHLFKGKKDWGRELFEEFLDAAVYAIAGYMYAKTGTAKSPDNGVGETVRGGGPAEGPDGGGVREG